MVQWYGQVVPSDNPDGLVTTIGEHKTTKELVVQAQRQRKSPIWHWLSIWYIARSRDLLFEQPALLALWLVKTDLEQPCTQYKNCSCRGFIQSFIFLVGPIFTHHDHQPEVLDPTDWVCHHFHLHHPIYKWKSGCLKWVNVCMRTEYIRAERPLSCSHCHAILAIRSS